MLSDIASLALPPFSVKIGGKHGRLGIRPIPHPSMVGGYFLLAVDNQQNQKDDEREKDNKTRFLYQ